MPELRQNFFTKEWVVIATERAKRPEQLIMNRPPRKLASFSQKLPFLPGARKSDTSRNSASPEWRRHLEDPCGAE